MSIFSIENQVIAITGGYGHLGRVISKGLAELGAKVCVLGRSNDKFQDALGGVANIRFVACDISKTESIQAALKECDQVFGKIDVLINNAMYCKGSVATALTDEEWAYSIDGSLNSVYRCIREVLPFFEKNGQGNIINVSSMYGMIPPDFGIYESCPQFTNPPHYGVAKAGVIHLSKYFAELLGARKIRVNTISPGPFPSSGVQENETFTKNLVDKTALKRIGNPEDLIGSFAFLSSGASAYITGHNLVIDGGWTLNG